MTQEFSNPIYSKEPSISDSSKYSVTSTTAKSRPIANSQASTQGKMNYKTTVKTVTLNKIPLKLTVSAQLKQKSKVKGVGLSPDVKAMLMTSKLKDEK